MSDETPTVSVIIPAYNRADVIARAVNSVLRQTLRDFEVLVVDDASTDETVQIVEALTDDRVRLLRHDKNRYAAAARNTGMEQARGRYVAFLDSDDEWHAEKLMRQVAVMDNLDARWGAIHTGANLFKNGSRQVTVSKARNSGDVLGDYLASRFVIWTPTFLFRRACLNKVELMDVGLVRSQDRDFFIRLLTKYKLAAISDPLVNVYLETTKPLADTARASREALLTKHRPLLDQFGPRFRREAFAIQWIMQAEQYLTEGRLAPAAQFFLRAVMTWPFLPPRRYAAVTYKFMVGLLYKR